MIAALFLLSLLLAYGLLLGYANGLVTANVADPFALIGLGSLLLLLTRSRDRFSDLPRPMIAALFLLSLLLAYGLLLGYANFGATEWALLNRGFGWVVILGYAASGLAVALFDPERGRWLILRLFVAAGIAVAALQLAFLVFLKLGFPLPEEVIPYRSFYYAKLEGYANNANSFGFQMTMTAIAAILAHRFRVLGTSRRWLVSVLVLIGLVIFFTWSRAALGMFAMLLVLSVAFASPEERHRALATSLVVAVSVALAAAAIVYMPVLDGASHAGARMIRSVESMVASDSPRWQGLADGWQYWIDRPIFGHGLGAYVERQLADSGDYLLFHSVPIWLMAEMGAVGLAAGLAAFGCLALGARRLMLDPRCRHWGVGLMMALICWGAANQVHDFAFQRSFWFFTAYAFGCSSAARRTARQCAGTGLSKETARR